MADTQVLEFELGSERYCVDIGYVAEIVDMDDLTPVPNSPDHIEGIMDLRGRTTSIVNPKRVLGLDNNGARRRIVVFDPEETESGGAVGWIVDEVDQVVRVSADEAEDPPSDHDAIRGVIQRDGEFVMWISPESVHS